MKEAYLILNFAMMAPVVANADPFMGEGKQAYIQRCINTAQMPGYSQVNKIDFCNCIASKLELKYYETLKSIKQTDSVAVAQQKFASAAQEAAKQCMR